MAEHLNPRDYWVFRSYCLLSLKTSHIDELKKSLDENEIKFDFLPQIRDELHKQSV